MPWKKWSSTKSAATPMNTTQRHPHSRFVVDFRHEVGGGDVDSYARRESESVADGVLQRRHRHHPGERRRAENRGRSPRAQLVEAACQHHRCHGEAFGNFVQEHSEEDDPAEPVRDQEARGDRHAVEERVDDQSEEHGEALVRVDELLVVRFFAEWKCGERVCSKKWMMRYPSRMMYPALGPRS